VPSCLVRPEGVYSEREGVWIAALPQLRLRGCVGSSLERSAALLWRQSDLDGVIRIRTCLYIVGPTCCASHLFP
jgi:hypothetical protein